MPAVLEGDPASSLQHPHPPVSSVTPTKMADAFITACDTTTRTVNFGCPDRRQTQVLPLGATHLRGAHMSRKPYRKEQQNATYAADKTVGHMLSWIRNEAYEKRMREQLSASLQSSWQRMLTELEVPNWRTVKLGEIDLNLMLTDYEYGPGMAKSADTLNAYRTRVRKALSLFEEYLQRSGEQIPDELPTPSRIWTVPDGAEERAKYDPYLDPTPDAPAAEQVAPNDKQAPGPHVLEHRMWVRPDFQLAFELPADLDLNEREAIMKFVSSLPVASAGPGGHGLAS
jgi:hypothetical protein